MYIIIKRLLDILFSTVAIIIFSPLLLILIIIIKINMGGPVFFKQKRVGKYNTIFTLYKFRSMKNTKDNNGVLLPDAKRITKFGNFLRKSSLDEIPQIFNIFLGQMSFIGPRPKMVYHVLLMKDEPYIYRHAIKPGFSSLSVINGRNSIPRDVALSYDLEHVGRFSFLLDVEIFFKTVSVVIKGFTKNMGINKPVEEENIPSLIEAAELIEAENHACLPLPISKPMFIAERKRLKALFRK